MENTLQPSLPAFRSKITLIEFMELSILGFMFWGLLMIVPSDTPTSVVDLIIFLMLTEAIILGSWAIYLAYIRLTRGWYPRVDIRVNILLAALTGTYTLWTWIALDINRFILAKLLYCGDAPVEYAWSPRSKQARKEWEQAKRANTI